MKVALLGNGWIGNNAHRKSFDSLKAEGSSIELVATCDVRGETESKCKGERFYTDFDELLKNEKELDMVLICLPTFLHAEYAIKAMEAGLHVLCEKPMALTVEDCEKMIACSKKTGKRLMVAHCCRFTDERRIMKKFIEDGSFGKPVSAFFCAADATPNWGWENWFADRNRSGGCMLDLQAHNIDLVNWFFGVPEFVSVVGRECNKEFEGYGSVSANSCYNDGLFVHNWSDWGILINKHNKRYIRINFEKGYVYQDMNENKELVAVSYVDKSVTNLLTERKITVSDYRAELEYFVECVENNLPFDICPPEESANVIKVMLAQEKSADAHGAPVKPLA